MNDNRPFTYAPAGWAPPTVEIDPAVEANAPSGSIAETVTVGGGLTPVRRTMYKLDDPEHVREAFKVQQDSETFGMGMEAFHARIRQYLPHNSLCPGLGDPQCCGFSPMSPCRGAWLEYQDNEWFAQELACLWNRIEFAFRHHEYGEAVHLAYVAGAIFHMWSMKGDPEAEWQWGRDKLTAVRAGAVVAAKAKRIADDSERVAAVEAKMAANPRLTANAASRLLASQGLGAASTIYTAWKRRPK